MTDDPGTSENRAGSGAAAPEPSRAALRALFDAALDAMIIVDGRARVVEANPAAAHMRGEPREKLIGRSMLELLPPDVAGRGKRRWREFIEQGVRIDTTRLLRADGSQIEVEYAGTAQLHARPSPVDPARRHRAQPGGAPGAVPGRAARPRRRRGRRRRHGRPRDDLERGGRAAVRRPAGRGDRRRGGRPGRSRGSQVVRRRGLAARPRGRYLAGRVQGPPPRRRAADGLGAERPDPGPTRRSGRLRRGRGRHDRAPSGRRAAAAPPRAARPARRAAAGRSRARPARARRHRAGRAQGGRGRDRRAHPADRRRFADGARAGVDADAGADARATARTARSPWTSAAASTARTGASCRRRRPRGAPSPTTRSTSCSPWRTCWPARSRAGAPRTRSATGRCTTR